MVASRRPEVRNLSGVASGCAGAGAPPAPAQATWTKPPRGQSLLEVLLAIAMTGLVLGGAFGALAATARSRQSDTARLIAASAAANAATELRAAVEYDGAAVAAVGNATWTVAPPSPPPGAPPADAAAITLSTNVNVSGPAALVDLTFSSAHANGATKVTLQQYAPAPGAQLYAAAPSPG